MRIEDLVSPEVKQKLNYNNQPKQKRKRKQKCKHHERLTENEIKRLMGQFEPTYRRHRGAWRSK